MARDALRDAESGIPISIPSAMSRFIIHTLESAPEASQPFVRQSQANNGFVPNLVGVLANAPVALETYATVSAINNRSSLSLTERETVQLTAARIHGCDFCRAGHAAVALKKAGLPLEQVRAMQLGQPCGDARLDAVGAFATAVIAHRGAVPDADFQAFLAHGFSQQQALEVVLGVSLATLCNFANTLAGTPVNPQFTPYLPGTL